VNTDKAGDIRIINHCVYSFEWAIDLNASVRKSVLNKKLQNLSQVYSEYSSLIDCSIIIGLLLLFYSAHSSTSFFFNFTFI